MKPDKLINLTKYVPEFTYENSKILKSIYKGLGEELTKVNDSIDDLINQCFINSATWALTLWEEEYGIESDLSLAYEERREIIKAKMRGQGTTTIEMIKNTSEAFSGGEVEIEEHNEECYFVVKLVGVRGIPKNMESFTKMLDVIKPAHLGYVFKYSYNTYGDIKNSNWKNDELKLYTYDDIRILNDIKRGE